jgi:transcriptional regulator with GAF, ATPase, and Fis domain
MQPKHTESGIVETQSGASQLEHVSRERDLLMQLLQLGAGEDLDAFLSEALSLLISVAGARHGYIEVRAAEAPESIRYNLMQGMAAEELSSEAFSSSVIAEAYATGEAIVTASARLDPRFSQSRSVRARRLEAVLCVPMGGTPPVGVVYLQDRIEPGPFRDHDLARTQLFARNVGRVADRLLWQKERRAAADATLGLRSKLVVQNIIGSSAALAGLFQQLSVVAPMNVGVLLTGESGTGKTQLARALHDSSTRAGRPFIELNCAALPDDLFESELFGAVPGGHSTATKRIPGKIEAAEGGTLFLDEIGELSIRAQAKLLQVLQSGTYFPLGSASPRKADIRVVAATNADLAAAVAARTFREDLYYRLNVFPIRVPSLAERKSDISALAQSFSEQTCEQNSIRSLRLSEGALMALQYRDWPGNVRELAHAVQAAALRAQADSSHEIERRHLQPHSLEARSEGDARQSFHEATRRFQASLLRDALARENWNVAATARTLGLTRAHMYNLLATYAIVRPASASGDDA